MRILSDFYRSAHAAFPVHIHKNDLQIILKFNDCPVRQTNFVRGTLTHLWINISCSFACLTAWNSSLRMSVEQVIHCCLQVSSIHSFSLFNILISDWILIMTIDCLISIYILPGFQIKILAFWFVLKSGNVIGRLENQPDGSQESIHSLFRHPRRTVIIWRPSFWKF